MKILWNTFEPSLTDMNNNTSAGGGIWTRYLWRNLAAADISVINVSVGETSATTPSRMSIKESLDQGVDLIVLCWRWPMPDYPARNCAYDRQLELLEMANLYQIPVLIHDEDMKSDAVTVMESSYPRVKYKATQPAFYPADGYETLMFPYDITPTRDFVPHVNREYDVVYVGNNYERYEQSKQYFNKVAETLRMDVWGNWLEPSSARESPIQVKSDMPNVRFHGRLSQEHVHGILSASKATVHLAKPTYCEHGFVTIRWAEAAKALTYADVPIDFQMPESIDHAYGGILLGPNINDVGVHEYRKLVTSQRQACKTIFRWTEWLKAINSLTEES